MTIGGVRKRMDALRFVGLGRVSDVRRSEWSPAFSADSLQLPANCPLPTFLRFLLTAYCLLLSAFNLPPSAFCQIPAGLPAQVSAQAQELVLQGFERMGTHDAVAAEKSFRQAIELQPELEPAHRGLGLSLREQGRLPEALRELQTATKLDPADADAHFTLGSTAWTLSLPANTPSGNRRGTTAADYQNLASAEFGRALALSPKDPMLRMSLAVLYLDSGRTREAVQEAEEATRIAPDNAETHVTLGRCYFASGEEEKAAGEYDSAVKLDSHDGGAYLALGQLRMFQRRTTQAEEALRNALKLSPNLGPAYAALAQILMAQEKNAEARSLLEKAVGLNAQDWQSQYELAVLLNQAGESARATKLLENVLRVNPEFPGAREQLADGFLRRGDITAATAEADKMIAADPQGAEGHRILALALWKQRDYDGSLAECAMALNADENSAAMTALQSIALWQTGRKKDAQKAFKDAAKLEPKIATGDVFCRLLLCDEHDIGLAGDFLRRNRWLLLPPLQP